MKIAITTPTGHIGSQLTKLLLDRGGHQLSLLVRDPSKVAAHTSRGAKAVKVDLENAAQVSAALAGAESVFLLVPPRTDVADMRAYQNRVGDNFAAAVKANKIKRVVFLSSYGAQHNKGTGPIAGLHDIEQKLNAALKETGGNITHLRPGSFMENWFMSVGSIKDQGAVYAPIKGDEKMPMIATADIATVAADVLADPKWSGNNVRELLGPRDYTYAEGVKIISEALGKPVKFVQVPPEQALQAMTAMGLSANVASTYVEMYAGVQNGLVKALEARNARNTTPTKLEDFARTRLAPAIKG
ncbi:MAG: NmrA family NAD(P)-binding protein [Planctomycetes bacterium]|nr:NmrA family NAD(P)-binding protein [Planctomycetota bacterium]